MGVCFCHMVLESSVLGTQETPHLAAPSPRSTWIMHLSVWKQNRKGKQTPKISNVRYADAKYISSHNVTAGTFRNQMVQSPHFTHKKGGGQNREASTKISILVCGRLIKKQPPKTKKKQLGFDHLSLGKLLIWKIILPKLFENLYWQLAQVFIFALSKVLPSLLTGFSAYRYWAKNSHSHMKNK